jgi:hypothetical protein
MASVVPVLPWAVGRGPKGYVPADLIGATIIAMGTLEPSAGVEGGGLTIDYARPRESDIWRVTFAFTEEGMWIHERPAVISSPSSMGADQTSRA